MQLSLIHISTREADQKFGDGVSHAVEKIIPILDTLDMAANAPTTDENYKKGVVMTLDKAAKALEALHVEEIEVLGKPVDPNFKMCIRDRVKTARMAEKGGKTKTLLPGDVLF